MNDSSSAQLWRNAIPTRSSWLAAPLICAVAFAAALVATLLFFQKSTLGQTVDQLAMIGARDFADSPAGWLGTRAYDVLVGVTNPTLDLIGPWFIAGTVLVLVAVALYRRLWLRAAGAVVILVGANLSTQAFKAIWPEPLHDLYPTYGNSWPSGHTTVAFAAGAAVLFLTPARWRGLVSLLGALVATLVAWGTILGGWHRPSDTVGAVLVVGLWYCLVEVARRATRPVPITRGTRNPGMIRTLDVIAGVAAALGIGILAATALSVPDVAVSHIDVAHQRLAFAGAFFGIAAVAFAGYRVLLTVGPNEP